MTPRGVTEWATGDPPARAFGSYDRCRPDRPMASSCLFPYDVAPMFPRRRTGLPARTFPTGRASVAPLLRPRQGARWTGAVLVAAALAFACSGDDATGPRAAVA